MAHMERGRKNNRIQHFTISQAIIHHKVARRKEEMYPVGAVFNDLLTVQFCLWISVLLSHIPGAGPQPPLSLSLCPPLSPSLSPSLSFSLSPSLSLSPP